MSVCYIIAFEETCITYLNHIFCGGKSWDNIGGWAASVSKQYKDWQDGKLSISSEMEHQFHLLRDIGFEFKQLVPEIRVRRRWKDNYEAFLQFTRAKGHGDVPPNYKGDISLARWVGLQRDEYRALCEGKPSKMTQDQYEKLESAGFLWESQLKPGDRNGHGQRFKSSKKRDPAY